MYSGKKPVNCTPCAKRKVRCDKRQPCCHCKRRKGDVCVYPVHRANGPDNRPEDYSQRIQKLEVYIRRLGGDPQLVEQSFESDEMNVRESSTGCPDTTEARRIGEAASPVIKTSYMKRTEEPIRKRSGLVEHDDQVTYIEAPMWYSWSGVKKPEEEPQGSSQEQINGGRPKSKTLHCFSALLDPPSTPNSDSLHSVHPPAAEITALWKRYLKNVHPLVMVFFDWEIEVIILKASLNLTTLTQGEQALVFAIYFIVTLSLSEEECVDMLHDKRPQLLDRFQRAVEDSLLIAELVVTSDRLVLQAFMLYLLVMRNRARPAAIFSLMGIASRIAERIGLHRDGDDLGLPVLRSEERRRMWWQLQHMEISIAQLVGAVTMTIYADWDTKLPQNLEDHDLRPDIQTLPPDRHGLTTMSHCLWRYQILHMQRAGWQHDGSRKALSWMLSPSVPLIDKDAMLDTCEKALGEQFLQYCEPLNPLHVHIQIGVRSFILAARRSARQPALINAKISEMSLLEREDFLGLCTKCLEYYVLSAKTESLRGFQWHNDNYFQWPAFVYTILEAHHRFADDGVTNLWSLIGRVYVNHPRLMIAVHHPDIASIVRITLVAWQRHYTHIRQRSQQGHNGDALNEPESPPWILELRQKFDLPEASSTFAPDLTAREPAIDADQLLPPDFDFDSIDWSFWENPHLNAALYETDW